MLEEKEKPGIYDISNKREVKPATTGMKELGPLQQLPGLWKNVEGDGSESEGRGWNLIALPFFQEGQFRNYRLLMNQYNEELRFTFIDDMVPNRGITRVPEPDNFDQRVVTLDYQQQIHQIAVEDNVGNGDAVTGPLGAAIHHEPGLFLHMRDRRTDNLDVARLATVPHGNAATVIGRSLTYNGGPQNVDSAHGFPEGAVPGDVVAAVDDATGDTAYLAPYKKFTDAPFEGIFSAKVPFDTFKAGLGFLGEIEETTELRMSSDLDEAGIRNIPFIERQADANFMRSTFYIMKRKKDGKMFMGYTQFIFLDFFPRRDGEDGLIRWPHISINIMEKVPEAEPTPDDPYMAKYSTKY